MPEPARTSRLLTLATVAGVCAGLYLAGDVLIPVALAALISFLLAPLAARLGRLLGNVAAVVLVVALACGVFGTITWVVAGQITQVAEMLPQYRENITAKIGALRGGALEKATEVVKQIEQDIEAQQASRKKDEQQQVEAQQMATSGEEQQVPPHPAQPTVHPADAPDGTEPPTKVLVVEPEPSSFERLGDAFGPLLGPLGTGGMVIVLVLFMLLARRNLRDRIVRLMGHGQIQLTTQAMDEVGERMSRYLLMQTLINVIHGVAVATGMFLLDVPNFMLWGLLSAVLRFVPYVGPIAAAALPILVSLAVFDTWEQPMLIVGYFVVLELLSNNLLEPWLYGSSAGVSPLAIIVTSIFWAWLWGPIGLLLATPLTVCMVVIGKHVPQFGFINILLGDEPVLEPHALFYQRLVAMDHDEALEVAEQELQRRGSLIEIYDHVLIPALILAEVDRHGDQLDERRSLFLHAALRDMIEELAASAARRQLVKPDADAPPVSVPVVPTDYLVLVLPAHDEADELVGAMLAQCVTAHGGRCEAISMSARSSGMIDVVQQSGADLVCISAVPPSAVVHARHVYKRVISRFPELPTVIGAWQSNKPLDDVRSRIGVTEATPVVKTMHDALAEIERLARSKPRPSAPPQVPGS